MKDQINSSEIKIDEKIISLVKKCKSSKNKMILLTAHRRESFNGGLHRVFSAVKKFAQKHSDVFIFFALAFVATSEK